MYLVTQQGIYSNCLTKQEVIHSLHYKHFKKSIPGHDRKMKSNFVKKLQLSVSPGVCVVHLRRTEHCSSHLSCKQAKTKDHLSSTKPPKQAADVPGGRCALKRARALPGERDLKCGRDQMPEGFSIFGQVAMKLGGL